MTNDHLMPALGIQLVTTADARYAVPLAVLAKSLELNLRTCMPATLHVIDGGLGWRNRRKIERSLDPARVRIVWLPPPDRRRLEGVPVFGHVNVSTYYRILVPDLLPDLCKVIYLDADMLVLGDLGELWSMPMNGLPLMAVQDNDNSTMESALIPGYVALGLSADAKVLNGGLLVMDLNAWRTARYGSSILEYLRRHAKDVLFWDQDGINAILAGMWRCLPYAWNRRVDCGCEPECREDDLPDAKIVHYSSSLKPWHYYCDHPGKRMFFAYLDQTAMSGWRPHPPLRAWRNRHTWGGLMRRIPLFGKVWAALRPTTRSFARAPSQTTRNKE